MRRSYSCTLPDISLFKQKALAWASRFDTACYLDHNSYHDYAYNSFDCVIAAGAHDAVSGNYGNAFSQLKNFHENKKDRLFGFFGYDLKNEIENLRSENADGINLPDLFFFQPEHLITIQNGLVIISSSSLFPENIIQKILDSQFPSELEIEHKIHWQQRFSREEYLEAVEKIKRNIELGDVYELNLCQEFFAENVEINPVAVFQKLNSISKAPFASFFKHHDKFLLCSSPERFIKKSGDNIISQPIKGTARRGANELEDEILKLNLQNDLKERAENVMIVDLVRNDLSRSCEAGTVQVEELFGVKTFAQVHQLVSTVRGKIREDVHFIDVIKNAFPMGSMTGAPKVKAMELIEKYERTKRGLYSGAVGYITAAGDFDFNVVIRSLIYNQTSKYLSYQVGSAITANSIPENEYKECLLKAKAMKACLKPLLVAEPLS